MASATEAGEALWHEGDRCLAPTQKNDTLREAIIQRLNKNDNTARIKFTGHNKDAEEEEEAMEEAILLSKLVKPGLNELIREKPLFPRTVTDLKIVGPLELSDVSGDRVPYTINRYLRDYQREGIRFIYKNYICSRGCILGDDMGLGKTVQVIGFLAAVLHKTGTWDDIKKNRPQFLQSQVTSHQCKPNKVFLIVAPLSVLYNWKDELDTWGHFQCVVVHGLKKEEELARIKKGRIEIALTTYESLRLCLDNFNNIEWSAVIVDEAHKIKNPNSQITQAMKELRCKIRIGLTGTILQNNLEELWCVMDWAIPGCLGSLGHFRTKFSDPIEYGQRHSATKRALATGRTTVIALARKICPWFLRRTKALIKEQLPRKDDRVVYCSLTDFQQTMYQMVLDTDDVKLLLRSSEKCDCKSGRTRRSCCYKTNSEGVKFKAVYFSYLAILRKVANHAALLQSTAGTSKKQERYVTAICQKVFQKFPDFVQRCKDESFEALSDPIYSGKMKVLQKLLKYYLQRRDKVLLFSLSTKLLDVLERYCVAEGLDYSRLDGTTKSKDRVQIVKEFNCSTHINLCLVSTMAGGLGLNFVGANVVVLFDPTWNPANDLQAIDRAYRIGQCRDVTVLRLISLGTVEEVIYLRQVYKQQLQSSVVGNESARRYFEAVQGNGVHKGELFGIKNLFMLQTQGTCLTRHILEREGQVEAGVMTTSTHTGEEERKGVSVPEVPSPTDDPAPSGERTKEKREASKIPRALLDFSSGSEEDEEMLGSRRKPTLDAVNGKNDRHNSSPSRMSLLHHGFSKLLERVKGIPELGEDNIAGVEESFSDTDGKDKEKIEKSDGIHFGISKISKMDNCGVCPSEFETKTCNLTIDSEKEDEWNKHEGRHKRLGLKNGTCNKTAVAVENESSDKKPDSIKTTVPALHSFSDYSDESEDFDLEKDTLPKKGAFNGHDRGQDGSRARLGYTRKRQSSHVRNKAISKYTEDIETFTSSEEEQIPPKKRQPLGCPATAFTSLKKQISPASKGENATVDSVLGGVKEVVYTHSNQHVVGGSKAEKLISRAAIRDVFERKMYSQLPANQPMDMQESSLQSTPRSPPRPSNVRLEQPSVSHPVTFASRSVHQTRHTTVIIGETPQAVRRQQLEEMAEKLKFPSVSHFAAEIQKSNSYQRLAWLRQYYTSLDHPDLANTVTTSFPQPDEVNALSSSAAIPSTSTQTAATKSNAETRKPQKDFPKASKRPKQTPKVKTMQSNVAETRKKPQNNSPKPQVKKKTLQKDFLECLSDIPSPMSEDEEETVCSARGHKRTERGSVSHSGAVRAGGGLGVDRASSSGLGSGEAAGFRDGSHRHTPSSPDLSRGRSATFFKPAEQGWHQEQKSSSKTGESFQGQATTSQSLSPIKRAPSSSSNRSLLTDLIGDTSILDDLLRPKPKGAKQSTLKIPLSSSSESLDTCLNPPYKSKIAMTTGPVVSSSSSPCLHTQTTRQVDSPVQVSKQSRKDFWDILNEGHEESINRLTDPAEVQRVCTNTNFMSKSTSETTGSQGLWKTNEKFLWKK